MTRDEVAPLMVVVACGSRSWTNRQVIRRRVSELRAGSAVIVGNVPGAGALASEEAARLGLEVLQLDAAPTQLTTEMIDWLFELTVRPEERLVLAFHDNLAASTDTARLLTLARSRGVAAEVITGEREPALMGDRRVYWLGRSKLIVCNRCGKPTWHRRHMGIGTFIAVACTSGLWLLMLPFYPRRCVTCGARVNSRHNDDGRRL